MDQDQWDLIIMAAPPTVLHTVTKEALQLLQTPIKTGLIIITILRILQHHLLLDTRITAGITIILIIILPKLHRTANVLLRSTVVIIHMLLNH